MLYDLFVPRADPPVAENALVRPVTILLRLAEREKLTTETRKHGDGKKRRFVKFENSVPLLPNLTKPV